MRDAECLMPLYSSTGLVSFFITPKPPVARGVYRSTYEIHRSALSVACIGTSAGVPPSEHRLHPRGRPRLRRPELLRSEEVPDAERRPNGRGGHPFHPVLRREHRLCPVPLRADDRPSL